MPALVDVLPPPDLERASEAVVERWLHQPGARVRANEPLLEVNTDKAVVEVPAPADGVLRDVLKRAGDEVKPGDVLGRIATDGAEAAAPRGAPAKAVSPAAPAVAGRSEEHTSE